jgi:hypothetical protein
MPEFAGATRNPSDAKIDKTDLSRHGGRNIVPGCTQRQPKMQKTAQNCPAPPVFRSGS